MVVGEDISVSTDDESGSQALLFELPLWHVAEETLEEIISAEITIKRHPLTERGTESAATDRFRRADVDYGWLEFFGQIGKRKRGTGYFAGRDRRGHLNVGPRS